MSRFITTHVTNPANKEITVETLDEPGSGGANYRYRVKGFNTSTNDSDPMSNEPLRTMEILFQNGPITEFGVNGITQEVLLAIVADRLLSFQRGPYACASNARMLVHVESALRELQLRTLERMYRGVEGTHTI